MNRRTSPPHIDQETVGRLLIYDSETGLFTRRIQSGRARAGDPAGFMHPSGYVMICLQSYDYMAHNLAWLITYGEFVFRQIDHRDNVKHHNWIGNLRKSSQQENCANRVMRKDNTSGIKGVSFDKASGLWVAKMGSGPGSNLGRYPTKEEAAAVRQSAFEQRYGEFARHA